MLTVIGETLIDVVEGAGVKPRAHVGGSPMNVAVGLARLGHAVQFLGRYGKDNFGQMASGHLADNSVLNPLPPDDSPTSTATALLDETGSATYTFELEWELDQLLERMPTLLQGSSLIHTGSIATMLQPGASTVLTAVEHARPTATISYDPNCRPTIITDAEYAREQAEKFVPLADVVKASDEDLHWLYPDRSVEESARAWLESGPAIVVVTRGGDAPWGLCKSGHSTAAIPEVEIVDTVGAGDSFMSALLAAIVDRELDGSGRRERLHQIGTGELRAILESAATAAAITVSRAGANPPSRSELRKHLSS
ncbi:carbohydrate kinase family protein [Arthrobacter castelli]|uniref:carbohydrate kinase family protein n=1 Tax=Arthrobacter castelli TaxID=271431 RepID=UPI0004209E55|nr:carbohydrate kinase [Arthrobacter castelli]